MQKQIKKHSNISTTITEKKIMKHVILNLFTFNNLYQMNQPHTNVVIAIHTGLNLHI